MKEYLLWTFVKVHTIFFRVHDIESRSSVGVDEVPLDELNRSKLKPEKESLLERLLRSLGVAGGMISLPFAIYSVILSMLKRESVVYIYSPAGRLWVTVSR